MLGAASPSNLLLGYLDLLDMWRRFTRAAPLQTIFFRERFGLYTPISPYITHVPLYTLLHSYRTRCNLTQANEAVLYLRGRSRLSVAKEQRSPRALSATLVFAPQCDVFPWSLILTHHVLACLISFQTAIRCILFLYPIVMLVRHFVNPIASGIFQV